MTFVSSFRRLLAAAALALAATSAAAAEPVTVWRTTVLDRIGWTHLAIDSKGNVYATEQSTSYNQWPQMLFKLSSDGVLQWSLETGSRWGFGVGVDPQDNVLAWGESFVAKYDPTGAQTWRVEPGYPVGAAAADSIGNVYFAGNPPEFGDDVVRVTKLDPNGNLLWTREQATDTSSQWLSPSSMVIDPLDQVHVVCWASMSSFWGRNAVVSYTPAGDLVAALYGWGYPLDATIDSSGRPVVVGYEYFGYYVGFVGYPGALVNVGQGQQPNAVALAKDQNLLVGAWVAPSGGSSQATIELQRRSGADFSLLESNVVPFVGDVAVDPAGYVYLSGYDAATQTTQIMKLTFDRDGDGVPELADCNDRDATIYPGAPETKHDGIDQECNGYDLTIDVAKAVWDGASVRVEATSALGAAARLSVAGSGPMTWKATQAKWIRNAAFASNPGAVTVCGVEGCVSAATTLP